jgi:hypothetical protein
MWSNLINKNIKSISLKTKNQQININIIMGCLQTIFQHVQLLIVTCIIQINVYY